MKKITKPKVKKEVKEKCYFGCELGTIKYHYNRKLFCSNECYEKYKKIQELPNPYKLIGRGKNPRKIHFTEMEKRHAVENMKNIRNYAIRMLQVLDNLNCEKSEEIELPVINHVEKKESLFKKFTNLMKQMLP